MQRAGGSAMPPSGAFLYAYCNVRTNQVLYSLERTLQPRHLKQLADVGANNNPPKLRKDVWRPLFTVALPQDEHGHRQSLDTFRQLREYRKLHETSWKKSPLLSRPYTQDEIDEMKKQLDQRGGAKKETVYDIIKRKKWKMRVKTVMDQKANSIADLAAVLLAQDSIGEASSKLNRRDQRYYKRATAKEMLALAKEVDAGGLKTAEDQVKALQTELEKAPRKRKQRLHWEIDQLGLKLKMMEFATVAVADARKTAKPVVAPENEQPAVTDQISRATSAEREPTSTDSSASSTDPQNAAEEDILSRLPSWPTAIDPWIIAASRRRTDYKLKGMPNRRVLRFDRPIFTTEGVTVSWANILDAEYAQLWPMTVQHRRMGLVRHAAPIPLESPENAWQQAGRPEGEERIGMAEDVASLRHMQQGKRNQEYAKRRERNILVERLKSEILDTVMHGKGQNDGDLETLPETSGVGQTESGSHSNTAA